MKKLFTICLIMATTFTLNAQTQPTKEETISWLKEKLKNNIDVGGNFNGVLQNVQVNECEILVTYYYTWYFSGGTTDYYDLKIPTQTLDIDTFNGGYFYLDHKGIKKIHTKSTYSESQDIGVPHLLKDTRGSLIIDLDGEKDLGDRIKKALTHLASFCPEKKKETF